MWKRVKRWFTARAWALRSGQEPEVQQDPGQPNDSNSFVGRASGDDHGYAGETGAERRARDDTGQPR
jgi:hypothetical protein